MRCRSTKLWGCTSRVASSRCWLNTTLRMHICKISVSLLVNWEPLFVHSDLFLSSPWHDSFHVNSTDYTWCISISISCMELVFYSLSIDLCSVADSTLCMHFTYLFKPIFINRSALLVNANLFVFS